MEWNLKTFPQETKPHTGPHIGELLSMRSKHIYDNIFFGADHDYKDLFESLSYTMRTLVLWYVIASYMHRVDKC